MQSIVKNQANARRLLRQEVQGFTSGIWLGQSGQPEIANRFIPVRKIPISYQAAPEELLVIQHVT